MKPRQYLSITLPRKDDPSQLRAFARLVGSASRNAAAGGHSTVVDASAGLSSTLSKASYHHECIDQAQPRVAEDVGQSARNGKPQALPQPHRALVRRDDEIKLHGGKVSLSRLLQ